MDPRTTAVATGEALAYSRYAARLVAADPALALELEREIDQPFDRGAMRAALAGIEPSGEALARALRQLRRRVMLRVIARDLTGRADLSEVCATVSALAEVALEAAVPCHHALLAATHGEPLDERGARQELIVVGMGKLGGGELNVSSDVDLVFVYPEAGETAGPRRLSNHEFFERLGRRVIAALGEITPEGFVFRVDMRLRPYGEAGPLASSFAMLEEYLVAQGREWERYAWLKARPLTGTRREELEALVRPFVFRKYLDFDAYENLRGLHRQITAEVRRRDLAENIKIGAGGIREVEFLAQALQLIRGGREPALQVRGTRAALAILAERNLLPRAAVDELAAAYAFLRNVEHRLQYRDDQQTQTLPAGPVEREALARAAGFAHAGAFESALAAQRACVVRHFGALFGAPSDDDAGPSAETDPVVAAWLGLADDGASLAALSALGYPDAPAVLEQLRRIRSSARYGQLPTQSRGRFDALVPQLVRAASRLEQPQATLQRLLTLLEAVSRRSAYLALLREHPPLVPRVAELMAASSWAAEYLTRHPILLDELLDARVLLAEPDWADWRAQIAGLMAPHADDPERQMDVLREFQHVHAFRLLARDLAGQLTMERLADHLSALADVVLEATLAACWSQMPNRHLERPRFAVVGYGKLGGKELGYASDLDLVFLYDDPDEGAPVRYARLAQRIITWLTTRTGSGQLYDVDVRLRPDGASGLMVTSIEAFREYQRRQAWTWEHQALTRARHCAGDAAVGAAFEAEREHILRLPRDPAKLGSDVLEMRARMHAGHPNDSGLFDVKHDPGGMIDVEFAVQYLVLAHSARHPELTRNLGNIALLGIAGRLGLVPAALAARVADAYRAYRKAQHLWRMNSERPARYDPARFADEARQVRALWQAVLG